MKQQLSRTDLTALILWLLPISYLLYIYPSMPKEMPLNFGGADRQRWNGTDTEFLGVQALLLAAALVAYLIPRFMSAVGPMKTPNYSNSMSRKLALSLLLFFVAIDVAVIYNATHKAIPGEKIVFPLFGLLFTLLGNFMPNLRPNYLVGFKTFYTMENEDNWRVTHRFAGRLWFIGGLCLAVGALLMPAGYEPVLFLCIAAILAVTPFIYSARFYKKYQKPH